MAKVRKKKYTLRWFYVYKLETFGRKEILEFFQFVDKFFYGTHSFGKLKILA